MRALILHGSNDLRLEEVAEPVPGPGEVVLAVEVAMTCGTDTKILRNGGHPALPAMPAPFGHEVTGRVIAVGDRVTWPVVGDAVIAANSAPCGACFYCGRGRSNLCESLVYLWGAYAERIRIPAAIVARNTIARPDDLPAWTAPMIEPVACAVHGVNRSEAAAGDTVIVVGGGVQGQLLCARLTRRGCRVIVCDPHPDRRERASTFGAVATADAPHTPDDVRRVRAMTPGGRGADVVFEAVGRTQAWEVAVGLARAGGEVNLYGGCPQGTTVALPTHPLHYAELRIQGSYHHTPETVREALGYLLSGDAPFDELLGEPVGLEEVPAVLAESGPKRPVLIDVAT